MRRISKQAEPEHFYKYMLKLQEERDRLVGSDDNYKKKNSDLVKEYLKTNDPGQKKTIREKLILLNLPLAHEMLYSKLNVNLLEHDSPDILQELNFYLVKAIDSALRSEDKKHFSKRLFYSLLTGLKKIGEDYYNYKPEPLEDPDSLVGEEKEKADLTLIMKYIDAGLSEREKRICLMYYLEGKDKEEIGFFYGLTKERITQILEKSIRKLRDFIEEQESLVSRKRVFREIIYQTLRSNPQIKYILVNPEDQPEIFSYETQHENNDEELIVDHLLRWGIDPREWLIVSHRQRIFKRSEYQEFRFVILKDIPFKKNTIFDWYFAQIPEIPEMFPGRDVVFEELKKLSLVFLEDRIKYIKRFVPDEEIEEIFERDHELKRIRTTPDRTEVWREKKTAERRKNLWKNILTGIAVTRYWLRKRGNI